MLVPELDRRLSLASFTSVGRAVRSKRHGQNERSMPIGASGATSQRGVETP
jgi:hypothetical protein